MERKRGERDRERERWSKREKKGQDTHVDKDSRKNNCHRTINTVKQTQQQKIRKQNICWNVTALNVRNPLGLSNWRQLVTAHKHTRHTLPPNLSISNRARTMRDFGSRLQAEFNHNIYNIDWSIDHRNTVFANTPCNVFLTFSQISGCCTNLLSLHNHFSVFSLATSAHSFELNAKRERWKETKSP